MRIHDSIQSCVMCDSQSPKYYCLNDKQYFCEDCWVNFHEGDNNNHGKGFL